MERLLTVILSVTHGDEYALLSGNVFNYITYSITAVKVGGGNQLVCLDFPSVDDCAISEFRPDCKA